MNASTVSATRRTSARCNQIVGLKKVEHSSEEDRRHDLLQRVPFEREATAEKYDRACEPAIGIPHARTPTNRT
jgi:hypothetical protein